jgi:N-acetylmuramoyl-L-alanine amidase
VSFSRLVPVWLILATLAASPAAGQRAIPDGRLLLRLLPSPDPVRVVVIDAGHGGFDPGSLGPSGLREKDVALAVALALAKALDTVPDLEVHLTRDRDVSIPIWERGEMATRLRGERPGVLISIHANALDDPAPRGLETYFLSEARTEHERRVAALENAPAALAGDGGAARTDDAGLAFILNELRNLDHIHWSADLASLVHERVAAVHPSRDRGVRQAPLAVITNALMPSILIELGFISNPAEERLLDDEVFQAKAAAAMAEALVAFFQRYPPRATEGQGRSPS